MKELTTLEIESVSGAGWLQDGLASLGSKIGAAVWANSSDSLVVSIPEIGNIDLAAAAPELGANAGKSIGYSVGGAIESKLATLPVVGELLNKWLGN